MMLFHCKVSLWLVQKRVLFHNGRSVYRVLLESDRKGRKPILQQRNYVSHNMCVNVVHTEMSISLKVLILR
jgi:hypothetical protein